MEYKRAARVLTTLFHPLLMPTLGMFILLNSGSYVSLLEPTVKKALIMVMGLGTLVFPLLMLPVLHYRKLLREDEGQGPSRLARFMVLVLFVMTWFYFRRLPLSRMIHGWVLAVNITMILWVLARLRFRVSGHLTALGALTGMVLALAFRYGIPAQGILLCIFAAAGVTGSASLLAAEEGRPGLVPGYFGGLMVALLTMLYY